MLRERRSTRVLVVEVVALQAQDAVDCPLSDTEAARAGLEPCFDHLIGNETVRKWALVRIEVAGGDDMSA
jgi:hypothetical protein